MKKKLTANALYIGAMVLAVGSLGCASGVENSVNGWAALGWTGAALVLGALSIVLAALGVVAEAPKSQKVHTKQKNTVQAARSRKKGA